MRRSTQWVVLGAAMLMAIPVGLGIAHAATSPSPVSSSPSAAADPVPTNHPAGPLTDDDRNFDPTEQRGQNPPPDPTIGMTPLSECPAVLEFFEQPEVKEFYQENFGYVPGPDTHWAGGCPDIRMLKSEYADERKARG